jgi:hypothetical protein
MNADKQSDILLDIYLDGQFIQTLRVDAPASATPWADAGAETHQGPAKPASEQPTHRSTVYLPASGGVCLEFDLRHDKDDPLKRNKSSIVYNSSAVGRAVDALGRVTTYRWDSPGAVQQERPEPPPDEPHIVE